MTMFAKSHGSRSFLRYFVNLCQVNTRRHRLEVDVTENDKECGDYCLINEDSMSNVHISHI